MGAGQVHLIFRPCPILMLWVSEAIGAFLIGIVISQFMIILTRQTGKIIHISPQTSIPGAYFFGEHIMFLYPNIVT